jgi:V8-like Glu-specific endopeptidase
MFEFLAKMQIMRQFRPPLAFALGFGLALASLAAPARAAVFGWDKREVITDCSASGPLARSTAIALLSSNVKETAPGQVQLLTDSLSPFICPDQKFSQDPSLSYSCTGFLVAPDLIATAGHCMVNTGEEWHETDTFCKVYSWLFDYQPDAQGQVELSHVSTDRIYHCLEVIYAVKDEAAPFRDFALVRLDRPVKGRAPLRLASRPPHGHDSLKMIGYPLGSPAKLSPEGKILRNDPGRQSFITNLDSFEGNSGAPVFNDANEVVGILVGGTPSMSTLEAPGKRCEIYNRCDLHGNNCALPDFDYSVFPGFQHVGSEVQRIAPLRKLLRLTLPN